ncbi:G-type lectin S-receptor-like serine/threonine-protein kinase LECRK3 [Silene latifolia]|uniref:G-type lectin S-receptor-like serine/threonine-protein kinase LECRK3 n=1 Tax=Silene latifolia TaxID=37657 RepID=UPI003D78ACB1
MQVWDAGKEINSLMSESNFTKGRFQLCLLLDGNLVLNTRDLATDFAYGAYYETGTNNPADNVGKQVVYSESGDMYVLRENGSEFDLINQPGTLKSTKNYYQRATLNYNGLLTWYSYPRASTGCLGIGWSEIQSVPDNICMSITSYENVFDSGACGYNSICNIDEKKNLYVNAHRITL